TAMSLISRHFSALGSASRLRVAPSIAAKSARCASSTADNGVASTAEEEDDFQPRTSTRREVEMDDGLDDRGDITFQSWLKDVGKNYKEPLRGKTNYLGGDRPFPMNPTFKPPPPLGATLREMLFNLHVSDPEKNSVRELSQRFGLSLKRVEAVIRLKGEEVKWQMEGRTLRKNFERGMESALGVKMFRPTGDTKLWLGERNSRAADLIADEEGASATPKHGVEKLWWEGVEDGKEAIVGPHLLARAARLAQKAAESEAESAQFAASHSHVVEPTVPGRSPTVFVDVGTKFVDTKDVAKRQKAADARRRLKEKQMTA
ncbi:hypothetical protein FRC01_007507, partial [Tulasnella sp. 417]